MNLQDIKDKISESEQFIFAAIEILERQTGISVNQIIITRLSSEVPFRKSKFIKVEIKEEIQCQQ